MRSLARVLPALLVATLLLLGGCSSNSPEGGEGEGDCARGVLFDGARYVERGMLDGAQESIGTGSLATCDDEGADAQGLSFPADGEEVEVWSISDVPIGDAVALEIGGSYAVLLNEELAEPRRAALIEELGLEG